MPVELLSLKVYPIANDIFHVLPVTPPVFSTISLYTKLETGRRWNQSTISHLAVYGSYVWETWFQTRCFLCRIKSATRIYLSRTLRSSTQCAIDDQACYNG